MYDEKEYVIYIRNFKQALKCGLVFKKVHRVNQEISLKPYIDTNTELRKNGQKKKRFSKKKFMNNADSGITKENVRKNRDIKLATTEGKKDYSVPEPNYHTTKKFQIIY